MDGLKRLKRPPHAVTVEQPRLRTAAKASKALPVEIISGGKEKRGTLAGAASAVTAVERVSKRRCDRLLKRGRRQGCQIFLDTKYQNGGKYTLLLLNDQIAKI
jgi:hypothetical protein